MTSAPEPRLHQSDSGIASVGRISWGAHFCQLFRTARDIADIAVPFVVAGVENGERCVWITGEPLPPAAARQALRAALPDLAELERTGRLELCDGTLRAADIDWAEQERLALDAGYSGLRVCEVGDHVGRSYDALRGLRVLLLCCHSLEASSSSDLIELSREHDFSLVRQHGNWAAVRSATALLGEMERSRPPAHRSHLELIPPTAEAAGGHDAFFYDEEGFPAGAVAAYLAGSIRDGGAAICIVADEHLAPVRAALGECGVDVARAEATRQLLLLDARETLSMLHDGDTLSRARFDAVIAPMVWQSLEKFSTLAAFGQMVDLLCQDGKTPAALELELYWNQLREAQDFRLLCAYGLGSFHDAESLRGFADVCAAHDSVRDLPRQPDGAELDTGRLLAHFEHRSRVLQHEVERRRELEAERTRLVEAERHATEHALSAHRHLALLQRVTAALSEAASKADVCAVLQREISDAVNSDSSRLAAVAQGDSTLRWIERDGSAALPCDPDSPVAAAFHGERAVWPSGTQRSVALPLIVGTRTIGALGLELRHPLRDAEDRALLEDVTRQFALAFDRADIYEVAHLARERAERANIVKDEFLAMLGHELRNPLSPMLTALQLMRLRAGNVAVKEREVIERQVRHMTRLVDDLLDISRITRGTLTLSMRSVELAEVVASAIELASPLLEERTHRLATHVPVRGLVVHGDPHRLAQAISNLLTNAAKYTANGGRIEVRALVSDGRVKLSVEDNGMGVEPALLARIFDSFVQGRQDIDRRAGGLGLGLAIVRQLVELHGGSVWAESAGRNRGATFTIELPLCQHSWHEELAPAGERDAAVDEPSEAMRVLVVDDNEDAAEMLAEVLRLDGYTVAIANDGPSALELASELRPDLALLDIGLPVMDGFELCALLSARLERAPKLFAVTGYGQPADVARTKEAGFSAHFTKPLDIERLRSEIRKVFEERSS